MSTTATTSFFFKEFFGTTILNSGTRTGTLADNDLIRGDDAGEGIVSAQFPNYPLFNGYRIFELTGPRFTDGRFVEVEADILASVTFKDGTTLENVRGLFDSISGIYGAGSQYFLLDPAALASAGKTIDDVADVTSFSRVDHDLDWSDFGITGTPIAPILPPPPPPPPVLNRIEGTAGRDVLRGTAGDDAIIGNSGKDVLTGRGGADTFVFGREASNGIREVDTITDYNVFRDTILLTNNVSIARTIERGSDLVIVLSGGDGDRIVLKNLPDSGPLYSVQFDADYFG